MAEELSVDWVEEIPDAYPGTRVSKYEPVAKQVRETGKIARLEAKDEKEMSLLAQAFRNRYDDLRVAQRKREDGFFVYISPKKEGEE